MAIGCGATCAKVVLVIFNIIFWLSGVVLVACGIWMLVDPSATSILGLTMDSKNSELFRNAAIILIAMGALVFAVGFVGCTGALCENQIVLGVYIALLIIICLGEIAGGVVAIVFKDKLLGAIHEDLLKSLKSNTNDKYYTLNNATGKCVPSTYGYLWDILQTNFNCCGVDDGAGNGYDTLPYQLDSLCPLSNLSLPTNPVRPFTCCWHAASVSSVDKVDIQTYRGNFNCNKTITAGCVNKIVAWIDLYAPVLIGIGIGIAMLEMFGIIFAVCLCKNVGNYDD